MFIDLNNKSFGKKNPQQSFFLLFGEIEEGIAKDVCGWILSENFSEPDERPEVLNLVINSAGGDLMSGWAIIDIMRGSAIPVRTVAVGQVASAGLMISMAGAKGHRCMTENTSIMSHSWSGFAQGTSHQLMNLTKEHNLTTERMIQHYVKCTNLDEKGIKNHLLPAKDVYLSAKEALKYGICDTITKLK